MKRVRIGVAGATGYSGQELLRIAARHPHVEIAVAMASSSSRGIRQLPALAGLWDGSIEPFSIDALAADVDVAFLGFPESVSAEIAPALLARGVRVFDLSGAFRLRDANARQRWYPKTPVLNTTAVYGLTEWNRPAIRDARFIACPGCYPTAALLALQGLTSVGVVSIDSDIYIDAKSGISGAGKKPTERTHFSERHGNVAAYGIFAHRHGAEIEQELQHPVTFVPHLVPLDRGILETIYVRLTPGATEASVRDALETAYPDAPFIRLTGDVLPEIKNVVNTNFCDIGWKVDGHRLVLVVCLDNLVKGAAGQAFQNFNVAYGLDERTGLL